MTSPTPAILLKQVRFGYDKAVPVVEAVNASLMPGRVTTLVGPNAAGKTTLLKLMLGLLRPWSGSVEVDGQPIHALTPPMRARWLSYVPQRPGVRFAFTVRQVIAMGAHGSDTKSSAPFIDQAIDDAGLGEIAGRVFMELSGGQQQRVLLARAEVQSAAQGRAMLLDEPGSHMDLHHRHAMMQRLRGIAERGLAVLVVLHDLDLAVRYADDAWLMDAGGLRAAGPWEQVLTPECLSPVYGLGLESIERGGARPLLAVSSALGDTMVSDSSTPHHAE